MEFPYPAGHEVPLFLAPMAGVSESPFRRLCRAHGADVVVTEFLSAEGIRRENEATIAKLRFLPEEHPIGVQIFGADPVAMGEAAALVTDVFRPDFVDINFGCPIDHFTRKGLGASIGRQPNRIRRIVDAMKRAVQHVPVTAKIRLGWNNDDLNYLDQAQARSEERRVGKECA